MKSLSASMLDQVAAAIASAKCGEFDDAFYALDRGLDCSSRSPMELAELDSAYDEIKSLEAA